MKNISVKEREKEGERSGGRMKEKRGLGRRGREKSKVEEIGKIRR